MLKVLPERKEIVSIAFPGSSSDHSLIPSLRTIPSDLGIGRPHPSLHNVCSIPLSIAFASIPTLASNSVRDLGSEGVAWSDPCRKRRSYAAGSGQGVPNCRPWPEREVAFGSGGFV